MPATRFTSGRGYARYDLPETQGVELRRIDVAPDGVRGALLGLELKNPGGQAAHRDRDGRRALRADDAVPVGLRRDGAERERQRARHRGVSTAARSCSATRAGSRARRRTTPTRRSSAPTARASGGETGPGHYGPFGAGRVCPTADRPEPMPSECDDGPFGRGTGGQLRYRVKLGGHDTETLWIAVAGSENSPGEARSAFARLTRRPERLVAEKLAVAARARAPLARRPAGRPALAGVARVGQAEPRRPDADGDGRRPPLDEGGQGVDA